ncbi:NUDIX hydrolase [Pelagicoccus sp. SDUM812003]|uniref:NUDIX hydrolase n=1 Tax=Pelagicoccus sp. SDUM812003 TaxID=3041267 RepID=UPI00280CFB02|nr:NUDIX hydrolase [Pelagicoccus sp. SDUM812003]MDQ8205299.1 NUDIX hydrolase [Pelagicoccus sp. SDUM812003]
MSRSGSDASNDPAGRPLPWERLSEELITHCPVFDFVSRRMRHPRRGTEADFYVLKSRNWVNVLPITPEGEVVMVRQYRFGIEALSWEIPGGVMDAGEEPVAAGLRELEEETGFVPRSSRLLGSISPNPAILDNRCYFVLADHVTPTGSLAWDEHEELETRLFAMDDVYAMAQRGEIAHSLVLNALFLFYPEWQRRQARRRS